MDQIIRLMEHFRDFGQEHQSTDLGAFGRWLAAQYADSQLAETPVAEVNAAGVEVMNAFFLGGLTAFVEVWIKLTFQGLPLLSLGDFGILKTVERLQAPTKSQVADAVIMERTTCMESIKRLIRKGIFSETTDPHDRRMKRVEVTAYGKEVSQELDGRMRQLGLLLMGSLTIEEMHQLLPLLKKLHTFHHQLYRGQSAEEIVRRYQLKTES